MSKSALWDHRMGAEANRKLTGDATGARVQGAGSIPVVTAPDGSLHAVTNDLETWVTGLVKANSRPQKEPRDSRKNQNPSVCWNCEQQGHTKSKCPFPPRQTTPGSQGTQGGQGAHGSQGTQGFQGAQSYQGAHASTQGARTQAAQGYQGTQPVTQVARTQGYGTGFMSNGPPCPPGF